MNDDNDDQSLPQFGKLPGDVFSNICSYLDAKSLLRIRCLNRSLHALASQGSAGWENLCHHLWKDKVHVLSDAREILSTDAMAAYKMSVLDARNRHCVTREELCFNPETQTGTIWSIRFKEAAGPDWTSWDPWFNYQPCRKMVFLEDGRVKTVVRAAARTETSRQEQQQQGQQNIPVGMELSDPVFQQGLRLPNLDVVIQDPPSPMTWRFVTQPLDLPARPLGSYIRFSVGGREVPTYSCRRSPTNNWGFVMESCWGIFASFELPPRPREEETLRHHNRHRRRRRLRRAHNHQGNEIYVQIDLEDSSSSSEDHNNDDEENVDNDNIRHEGDQGGQNQDGGDNDNNHEASLVEGLNRNDWSTRGDDDSGRPCRVLVDDDSFNVTITLQWREAFLYNFGAQVLPEGPGAQAEFQRIYGDAFDEDE